MVKYGRVKLLTDVTHDAMTNWQTGSTNNGCNFASAHCTWLHLSGQFFCFVNFLPQP